MSKTVFFITQLGNKDTEIRRRADDVEKGIILPAVDGLDIKVERADKQPTPGLITEQIIRLISSADVIIADLTGHNPNVYYELGVAHSLRKPVVLLADGTDSLTFDVKDERIVTIGDDGKIGVSEAEAAAHELRGFLDTVLEPDFVPTNVVTSAASSRSFDELAADDPERAELANVRETVEVNHAMLRSLVSGRTRVPDPDLRSLTQFVERFFTRPPSRFPLPEGLREGLITPNTSGAFDSWVDEIAGSVDDGWLVTSFRPNVVTREYGPDEAPF